MRCISPHGNYSIQVIAPTVRRGMDASGSVAEWFEGDTHSANFEQQGLTDWEVDAALTYFNFSGLPDGVNPLTQVSVFDSEVYVETREWPDHWDVAKCEEAKAKLLERIDAKLVKYAGKFPDQFIVVAKPATDIPWPTYDDDTAEEILTIVTRLKINPEKIRLYEVENQNRAEIVDAMLALEDPKGIEAAGVGDREVVVTV